MKYFALLKSLVDFGDDEESCDFPHEYLIFPVITSVGH